METYMAILISTFVAIIAVFVNHYVNKKNRNINTAMQLIRDYYQDNQFTQDRIKLWSRLKELPDEQHDFDKILQLVKDDRTSVLKEHEVVALNRTAAFYNSLRSLIDLDEVDLTLLKRFFGYNYNRFWEPERAKFENNSNEGSDKSFFSE